MTAFIPLLLPKPSAPVAPVVGFELSSSGREPTIALLAVLFGGPMRIRALPRSVRAPRLRPSGKSSSAFFTRMSKRSRNSFAGVFRSGSRRAQNRAMNFSASSSEAIFFHSFFSSSVAR